MSGIVQAIWVELLKVRRSRMPLLTALSFGLVPLAGGFMMVVLKDPELARQSGLISAKAQIVAGVADWPTYLGFLAQATAVGGMLLFSLIGTWVFGREYVDRTLKDLLALPTPRSAIVGAKFVVVALWAGMLTTLIYLIGLAVGVAVALPPAPLHVLVQGGVTLALTACLTLTLVTPVAFFASAGRGYLAPMGAALLALVLAQLIAWAGWGAYFPWSIPALYAGFTGKSEPLGVLSYAILTLTSAAGMAGTFSWWKLADQTH